MAVATYEDVAVALGRPITDPTEQGQVTYWLNAVELVIISRLGPIGDLDQAAVKFVETEAVATRMQNPNGYQSETIDDYTYRFGSETRSVSILDEWWRLLSPTNGQGAFTIHPSYDAVGSPYPDWWHDQ